MDKKLEVLIVIAFLLTGCKNQQYQLKMGEAIENNQLIEIYSYSDNQKIYSSFKEIQFQKGRKILSLKEALDKKEIAIEDIIADMELKAEANDGGSLWYQFLRTERNLANKDFILVKCNSLEINGNNKNIYIGNNEKILDYCTQK